MGNIKVKNDFISWYLKTYREDLVKAKLTKCSEEKIRKTVDDWINYCNMEKIKGELK